MMDMSSSVVDVAFSSHLRQSRDDACKVTVLSGRVSICSSDHGGGMPGVVPSANLSRCDVIHGSLGPGKHRNLGPSHQL